MFNKSFWAMKQDLAHGHGIGFSLFGGQGVAKGDKQAILDFNKAIESSISKKKAWAMTMSNASISAQNMTRDTLKAKGSLVDLANGLKATSFGAKAAELGLKALSVAGNMLLSIGITMAISAVVKGFQSLANAQEDAIAKADEFIAKFNEQRTSLTDNKNAIDSISEDYEDLAKGVDSLGRNVSLNSTEYARYNEIVNQIADMFPQMVQGYTDEGNAIITHKGNVEELTKAYKEQKRAAQDAIIVGSADVFEGFKAKVDKNPGYIWEESGLLQMKDVVGQIVATGGDIDKIQKVINEFGGSMLVIGDVFDKIGLDKGLFDWNTMNAEFISRNIEKFQPLFNTLNTEIEAQTAKIKPIMQAYLEQSYGYQGLDEDVQDIVRQIVGQFDSEFYKQFDNETEMASWVTENIVNKFKSKDGDKLASELQMMLGIQTQFNNDEITVSDYQEKLSAFIELIKPLPDETEKYIKLLFGISDDGGSSDIDTMIANVEKNFKGKFKEEIGSLELGELEILSNLDISPEGIEDWSEVEILIANVGKAANITMNDLGGLSQKLIEQKQALAREYQKATDWGLSDYLPQIMDGTIQSTFGNVDMDKRTIITWSEELKETYKDALASWEYDPEVGSIDTVFGQSSRFGEDLNGTGWEVAFTPILPDGTFLSKETIENYINTIIAEAYKGDGKVTEDELKEADAQGRQIGNTFVKGIFAGVDEGTDYESNGNWADVVGRLMHFSGDFGAVDIAKQNIATIEEQIDSLGSLTKALDDIQSAYNKVKSAIDEYNEQGYLSVDTFQELMTLEPEYLRYLTDEKGNLNLTTSAMNEYTSALINNMATKQIDKIAEYVNSLTDEKRQLFLTKGATDDATLSLTDYIATVMAAQIATGKLSEGELASLEQMMNNVASWAEQAKAGIGQGGLGSGKSKKDTAKEHLEKARDYAEKVADIQEDLAEKEADYAEKVADIREDLAEKEKEFAENMAEAWKEEHLAQLEDGLEKQKNIIDKYKKNVEVLDFGLEHIEADDFTNRSDILSDKLDKLKSYGAAMREEFDRVANTIPQTAEEATALASRLEELGSDMRDNVSVIRETTVELQKLSIDMASSLIEDRIGELQSELDNIDKRINILNSGYKDSYKYASNVLSMDMLLPVYSEYDKKRREKQRADKALIKTEQETQDKINEIVTKSLEMQAKQNAEAREKERQKLIEDMEKARQDARKKLAEALKDLEDARQDAREKLADAHQDYLDFLNDNKLATSGAVQEITDMFANAEIKLPEIDITSVETALDKVKEKLKDVFGGSGIDLTTVEKSKTGFINPTSGGRITSGYGYRTPFKTTNGNMSSSNHQAIDISGGVGTPIYAIADGTVIKSAMNGGYGYTIEIEHADDYVSKYHHMNALSSFSVGDKVKQGDEIGQIGETGNVTGAHLDFQLSKDGKLVDPTEYIPGYAVGTPGGNAKAGRLGIAGENYKPEILIDKATGKATYIDEPTVIDPSKTDVVGEKATAKIPKFADGTIPEETVIKTSTTKILANDVQFSGGVVKLEPKKVETPEEEEKPKKEEAPKKEETPKKKETFDVSTIEEFYNDAIDSISYIEKGIINDVQDILNDREMSDFDKSQELYRIKSEAAVDASKEGEKVYKKLSDSYNDWLKAIDKGTAEWSLDIYNAYKDAFADISDLTYDLADGAVEAKQAVAEASWQNSDSWIGKRNQKGDWELFDDSEVDAWKRVVARFEEEYPEEIEKINEAKKNLVQAEQKAFTDYINERNQKGDWESYGESEYEAWKRYIALLKEEYPDELAMIKEAEQKATDARYQYSTNWINERNAYNDWELFGDTEVKAWERVVKWLNEEYPDEIEKINKAEKSLFDARKKEAEKSISDIEDYINARNNYNDWAAYGDSELRAIRRITKIIEDEYKQRLISHDEYIDKLEEQSQRIYSLAQSEIDKNLSDIDKYIGARNFYNDWDDFGDSEVNAIKRQIQYLDAAYKQKLISYEEYTEKVADYTQKMYSVAKDAMIEEVSKLIEDYEEMKNLESSQLNSQKTLLQSYYDVINAISEAQHEINKELAASKSMYEYLNEETRELLFNQEDYNALNKELLDIQLAAEELQKQYQEDILNASTETIAEITSQYQMQYETMMKKYEIAKAELDVAKKRQKLDNVLAERNTRMFVNGQWQWVAKTQDVIDAKNELAEAEIEKKKQEVSLEQTEAINSLTSQINSLETDLSKVRKYWSDMQEMLNGESDEVAKALREISQVSSPELKKVINTTGGTITSFSGTLSESTETMFNIINGERGFGTMAANISTIITDLEGYSNAIKALTATINNTEPDYSSVSKGNTYKVNPDGKAPAGLKVGDKVVTAAGTYKIDSVNADGSYESTRINDVTTDTYKGSYANPPSSSSGGSSSSSGGSSSSKGNNSSKGDSSGSPDVGSKLNGGTVAYIGTASDGTKVYYDKNGNTLARYASGTGYTKSGLSLMGEEGLEAFITNDGRFIPISQPTIGNIGAGGIVFNREQMANLRNLWDLSNLSKISPLVSPSNANSQSTVIDNSIHINGLTVGEQGNEDWINGLRRYVTTHK